jgi:pyruvate dehydrogenase E2 component (dihydrolipoamide acetyltransferase)
MVKAIEVTIPDIGGAVDVDVIDILVAVGDTVAKDDSLVTLEGDKATMDIPSPYAGTIQSIQLKVGDKVAQGSAMLVMEVAESEAEPVASKPEATPAKAPEVAPAPAPQVAAAVPPPMPVELPTTPGQTLAAGPAVRRLAREFGVDLSQVRGSGRKGRIGKEDVQAYVKARLSAPSTGALVPPAAPIDFSKFGPIETKPLNKIKKLTGLQVHRSWVTIPLEAFRLAQAEQAKEAGYKLTLLAFVCSIVSKALRAYPQFNASLDASGNNLIYKQYCNIGIAVETPNGLVVPVINQADTLTVSQIAAEMARLSLKAREKGLSPTDMAGGCFTISSLGGIGGTGFTPIVNSPEVAILGLSRSALKPVYLEGELKPRLMLPLSLSYDHRVIDGAEAARFTRFIVDDLNEIRRILL